MDRRKTLVISSLLGVVALAAALVAGTVLARNGNEGLADTSSSEPMAASHGGPVADYVSLVDHLRAEGFTVAPQGDVSQPFLSVPGTAFTIDGQTAQAYEYAGAATLDADLAKFHPSGGAGTTVMVDWVDTPHLFKRDTLLVIYIGDGRTVLDALTGALGPELVG